MNIHLIEIGQALKSARESSGLKIDELSNDLEIPVLVLEQIEEGSIGAFKDIFKLKEYLKFYSRYLGLDEDEIIDEFNEYMFEKTSKIPMDEIEKVIKEKTEEEDRLASPYTKAAPKSSDKQFVLIVLLIIILVIIAIFWSVKQIT